MAPRPDVPQNGAERARSNQEAGARRDPAGGHRGTPDLPFHVKIIGADDSFYEAFRSPGGRARSDQSRRAETEVRGAGFETFLNDAQAIQAASKQAARNLQLAADSAQQFTRRMTAEAERSRRQHEDERVNVEEILLRMERMAAQEREERQRDRQADRDRANRPQPAPRPDDDWDDDRPHPVPIPLDEDGDGTGRPPDAPGAGGGGGGGGGGGNPPGPAPGPAGDPDDPAERPGVGPRTFDERVDELRRRAAEARRNGQTTTGGLNARARRAAGEFVHERYGEGTSRTPTIVPQHDENGVLTHYNRHHPDGTVERLETDAEEIPGLLRTAGRQAVISGASSALAAGGFMAAARAVPVVGTGLAVLSAANKAAVWMTEQREQNAAYQSVYGGSNLEGIGGRIQEEGFVWGQRYQAGMTEEMSRQAFRGVTAMGYSGADRSDRLDFATDMYKHLGMGVEQSLQAMSIAAKSANTNFSALQRGLKSVTLAARSTGQAAGVLRDNFMQNFAVVAQAGLGNGATSLAAGLTNATLGVNRRFDQIDTSGVGNTTALRIMGAQTGQTYGQLLAGEQRGDTEVARQLDTMTGQAYSSSVGPNAQGAAQRGIEAAGGPDRVRESPGAQKEIALDVMDQADWDSEVVAENLFSLTAGQIDVRGADPTVVAEQYVAWQSGVRYEGEQRAAQEGQNPRELTPDDKVMGGGLFGTGPSKFVDENMDDNWGPIFGGLGSLFSGAVREKQGATEAYGERQGMTNQSDPVIEDLITNYGDKSEVGYEVQTADGPRVVGLDEAIRYYPDQLANGSATIVGGEDSGKSVETAVGFAQTEFEADDNGDSSTGSPGRGMSREEWEEQNPTSQTEAEDQRGSIRIEASDELRRMFNFTGQGVVNPQVEAGADAGLPPVTGGG